MNMDREKYGTVAEIGAGQEVARWFFRVGGAAGTIAKSMSAYDMTVSDVIYGTSTQYVSRERLLTMLSYEYGLLTERLVAERGSSAQFFSFANTVTARSYSRRDAETHGWMGLRFQHQASAEPSDIVLHVRMLDSENVQQQEALGILGVNLIYGGFHLFEEPEALMSSLLDSLSVDRLEINLMRCRGPAFPDVDHRLLALELVERRLTEATMFRADGEVVDAGELLYKKNLLIVRGSFRPVTHTTVDLLRQARTQFLREPDVEENSLVVMAEMTLHGLTVGEGVRHQDFLDRVDILAALGMHVLISSTYRNFRLASYLFQHTKRKIGTVMGLPALRETFQEEYFSDLEGGILEALGRQFKNDARFYVYPAVNARSGEVETVQTMPVPAHLAHLRAHLVENRFIQELQVVDRERLAVYPRDVLAKMRSGDASWESHVPEKVAALIKDRHLLGYSGPGEQTE